MAVNLDKVIGSVAKIENVADSAIEFISSVPQMIRDEVAKDDVTDATHINALADRLEAKATKIAEAIVANTVAEGEQPSGGVVTGDEPAPGEETGEGETGGGGR
jgi:hypothetical protein